MKYDLSPIQALVDEALAVTGADRRRRLTNDGEYA